MRTPRRGTASECSWTACGAPRNEQRTGPPGRMVPCQWRRRRTRATGTTTTRSASRSSGIATSANWRTPITGRPCSTCVISPPTTRSPCFRTCARFTDASSQEEGGEEGVLQATRVTPGLPAHRIGQLSEQIRDVDARPARLVKCHAPQLFDVVGIGPDVALLITVGDIPERLGSEEFFAALCGVSPVERSSGRRHFRRLNRGGDRQANAALHRIVFTRLRVDSRTQDYFERRIKEGKTRREIVRCLKRCAAREVFHLVGQLQPGPRS